MSFAKKHLEELHHEEYATRLPCYWYHPLTVSCSYYVCEKTDGIRCLLYCTHGETEDTEAYYLVRRIRAVERSLIY